MTLKQRLQQAVEDAATHGELHELTRQQTHVGMEIHETGYFNADGTCTRWKITSLDYRTGQLSLRRGLKQYARIGNGELHLFHRAGVCPQNNVT